MSGCCCYLGSSIFSVILPIKIPIKQNQNFVSANFFYQCLEQLSLSNMVLYFGRFLGKFLGFCMCVFFHSDMIFRKILYTTVLYVTVLC